MGKETKVIVKRLFLEPLTKRHYLFVWKTKSKETQGIELTELGLLELMKKQYDGK